MKVPMVPQSNHGSQAYLKTKVMTASPAELRLMLFDGAIRFTEQVRRGYTERDYELAYDGTTKAQAIIMELLTALRPDHAPELCVRLSALYTYIYKSLVEANSTQDVALIDDVLKLLRFERETWKLCIDGLARENQSAAGMRTLPRVAPTNPGDSARGTMSIQG